MSRKTAMVLMCLLTALNVGVVVVNTSIPSRAALGGMTYEDLVNDPDFVRAVKAVASTCKVNVDLGALRC
jgi:predicted ATPase